MTRRTEPPDAAPEDVLRLSHRLVALHVAGLAVLVLAVLFSVGWVTREHNRLALESSQSLVRSGINSFGARLRMMVKDYSVWDDAYTAASRDDRDWLYHNIGTAAVEVGTLDLIELVIPAGGRAFGWRRGSPEAGEPDLLPRPLLEAIPGLIDAAGTEAPTMLAAYDGGIWAFAAARIVPVAGAPAEVAAADLPLQIHGIEISPARLARVGRAVLVDDLALSDRPKPGEASLALAGRDGAVVGYVVWAPPRPGAGILRQVALPLGLALLLIAVVSAISSRYAVASARRLEEALRAARAADQSKTEFLSTVSHELRTPMNGILGVAQLLRTTELDDEQSDLVDVLFASANAQMALISDLLDFSRIEGGNRRLVAEPFEPARILQDLADMMRVAADEKGIGLAARWDAAAEVVVQGDGKAFRQIVTNLVGNAVKFTDCGRVAIDARARAEDARVEIAVEVADTGRGIAAEALPRVFERFYQADSSLARATEGTGLGLAISQNLAQMMGGAITVTSAPGAGSTFTFTASYPVAAEASEERDAA